MGSSRPQTKAAQREATVRRLTEVGRALFAQRGYAQTATEEIVQQAAVTRGALYHHFASKEGLFRAVVEQVQREIAERIAAAAEQHEDPWRQLLAGCHAFLGASLDPEVQRILLIDAPAVLGWETWRTIDAANGMEKLREGLQAAAERGDLAVPSLAALTQLLSGAMNEAALWIARSPEPERALGETTATLDQLLEALRARR